MPKKRDRFGRHGLSSGDIVLIPMALYWNAGNYHWSFSQFMADLNRLLGYLDREQAGFYMHMR
jgi:hypothetical protein